MITDLLSRYGLGLRRLTKIPELGRERALECRPCGAALNVGSKTLVARHDVGVAQNAEHGGHHQIAGGEASAIEIRFFAERLGECGEPPFHELHSTWTAQLRPLLVCVENVDEGDVHHERFD